MHKGPNRPNYNNNSRKRNSQKNHYSSYPPRKRARPNSRDDRVEQFGEEMRLRAQEFSPRKRAYHDIVPAEEDDWLLPKFEWEDYLEEREQERLEERQAYFKANPDKKKSNVICSKYLQGLCIYTKEYECPNLHVYEPELFPICRFFIRGRIECTNPDCVFRHPGRGEEVLCLAYANGFCKDGERCDYTHKKLSEEQLVNMRHHVQEAMNSHTRFRKRGKAIKEAEDRRTTSESRREMRSGRGQRGRDQRGQRGGGQRGQRGQRGRDQRYRGQRGQRGRDQRDLGQGGRAYLDS